MKWEQHKRGRVVHALTFTFGPKAKSPQTEIPPSSAAKPKFTREYVQQHAQPGESCEQAWERLRRRPEQAHTN